MKKVYYACFMALMSVAMFVSMALADNASKATGTTTTYAWESGLSALKSSLTGPIAGTVAVAAFALCTWQIIRGAELSSWVAPMIVAALAVATMVNADTLITTLGGTTINDYAQGCGAELADPPLRSPV